MAKEKLTPDEKAKLKLEKIQAKQETKAEKQKIYTDLKKGFDEITEKQKDKEYIKKQKVKKVKEKFDYRTTLKEMPIKMVKEVNKIRWPKREELGAKFGMVIIFLIIFCVFFYFIDWGLQELFAIAKII